MATPTAWSELARPVLRPGLHVVRRDDRHLQLGLDPPDRLVLRDRAGLREALTDPHPPGAPEELLPLLDRLVREGWVVDAAERQDERRQGSASPRPAVSLTVHPVLEPALVRACATERLAISATAPVRLVATVGEPRRSVSDSLVREDSSHLWLSVLPGRIRIGPYVEPGRTACLRCLDAHAGDRDPRRATVLHQLEEPPVATFDPDPCLVQLGVAWAVRDVVRRLGGHPSSLASATIGVTSDLEVTRQEWLRHPHCGCAWG